MTTACVLTTCVVCGTTASHGAALGGVLAHCASCGFTWTAASPPPPEELYDDRYFSGAGYEDYFVPSARRFEAGQRLGWLLATGPAQALVEAGSAGGYFLEAAGNAGIAAHGVEISAAAVRFAQDELGVSVVQGGFESAVLDSPVQVVCAFHVLEHVADPREFLRACWRALEPGGRLALEVPNYSSVAARRMGTEWPGLQPAYHRWHFAPESLARMVTEIGFQIIQRDTTVFRYYMPAKYRRRAGRRHILADLRNLRSLRLTDPRRGDLLRLIARRPHSGDTESTDGRSTT